MPSSYTPNFNLNQWEAHDKVERIDFNADNAKIDAALFNHHSAELICTVKAETADVTELILDVSSLDWSRYFMLYMDFQVKMMATMVISTDAGDDYWLGSADGIRHTRPFLCYFLPASRGFAQFYLGYSGETLPAVFSLASGKSSESQSPGFTVGFGTSPHPYKEIPRFIIRQYDYETFSEGSKINLWGIK